METNSEFCQFIKQVKGCKLIVENYFSKKYESDPTFFGGEYEQEPTFFITFFSEFVYVLKS